MICNPHDLELSCMLAGPCCDLGIITECRFKDGNTCLCLLSSSALCVVLDGLKPLDESQPVREVVNTADPLEVSLVVSLDSNVGGFVSGPVHGKGRVTGVLEARAFCNEKEQVGKCIKMLKVCCGEYIWKSLVSVFSIWDTHCW